VQNDGRLTIAKESIKRLKNNIRQVTRRTRGRKLEEIIKQLNEKLVGWIGYFRLTGYPSQLQALDKWIHRRLRCYRLKQKKRSWSIAKYLMWLGVERNNAWLTAKSSKGWWRLAKSPALHQAMNNAWFDNLGLVNLRNRSALLNI